jgi:tetratricopeptide (TPR) repeat protein
MLHRLPRWTLLLCLAILTLPLIGCKDKRTIAIRYERPAQYQIPQSVHKVAIVEFGATGRTEKKWGELAADDLASAMDALNQRYRRYVLIDRKRVAALMEERDFQMSVSSTDSAVRFGEVAQVDAMIYGTVSCIHEDSHVRYEQYDYNLKRNVTRKRLRRIATVAVNFTMDDVHTHRTLCSFQTSWTYDSEEALSTWDKMSGGTDSKIPSASQIITRLIDKSIQQFVAKISPHQVTVKVQLDKGKSDYVEDGNEFAFAGEYRDAIAMYQQGLVEKPEDAWAYYNMGVCYEAMGELQKAEECYDRALGFKTEKEFIQARRRVRVEDKNELNRKNSP